MDAYQQAVEYLTANPGEIEMAWKHPRTDTGGCLFRFAQPDGERGGCCLTMIRGGGSAETEDATIAIRSDERLPVLAIEFETWVDSLPAFAQWQRWLDKRYNRTPPELDPRIPLPTKEVEFELPETLAVGRTMDLEGNSA